MRNRPWKVLVEFSFIAALVLGPVGCGSGQTNGTGGGTGPGGGGGGNGGPDGPTAGEYLWEFSLTDQGLYISTIDEDTGQLGTPTASGGMACNSLGTIPSIAVAPSNRFVFVIDKCFTSIHVYSIHGPGVVLDEIPESPYFVSNVLNSIALDPGGNFLYSVGNDPGTLFQFAVDGSTGELTINSTTTGIGDVRQVAPDPQGKYIFVNNLTSGEILSYSVGGNGTLSSVVNSPFTVPSGGLPVNLTVTSDGKFVYAPLIPSGIAAFAADPSTGALADIEGSPFSTSNQPFSLAIGAGGKYIYSIGGSSNNTIEGFNIDANTGALTPLPQSPFAMPISLSSLAVDSSGNFLYATVNADMLAKSAILGFAIDFSTGNLSTLLNSPFPAPPFPVDVVSLKIP
jgi:6-phosphogluconolactonase (cycloisomerase 2 family)